MLEYMFSLAQKGDAPGRTLIKLVFGKNAADLFASHGIHETFREQRTQMLNLIQKKTDAQVPAENMPKFKMEIVDVYKNVYFSGCGTPQVKQSISCERNLPTKMSKISDRDLFSVESDKEKYIHEMKQKMSQKGVPPKYIEHWNWLSQNSEFVRFELVRFEKLLDQVYQIGHASEGQLGI